MKGTGVRDSDPVRDAHFRQDLLNSPKTRAENLMVTDMLRNDLGRLAEPGGVSVPHLFDVEAYPTVWQMTSTVRAEIADEVTLAIPDGGLVPLRQHHRGAQAEHAKGHRTSRSRTARLVHRDVGLAQARFTAVRSGLAAGSLY